MTPGLHEYLMRNRRATSELCTICGLANLDGKRMFRNHRLLGTDDSLCFFCVSEWYGGIVDRDQIRSRSLVERNKAIANRS